MAPKPSARAAAPAAAPAAKATSGTSTCPPASLNGADWGSSDAKKLIAQDMLDGLVPVHEPIKDVAKLCDDLCKHQPEFNNFPFDLERHKSRIKRLQTVVRRLKWGAQTDKELLAEARAKFPKTTHGPTGVMLWKDSEADHFLDLDMEAGLHLLMVPSELRKTRPRHQHFAPSRFSKRIDQKKEMAKPCGMNPMQAAAKKEKKKKKKKDSKVKNRPDISRASTTGAHNDE